MLAYYLIDHQDKFQQQNLNLDNEVDFAYDPIQRNLNVNINNLYIRNFWGDSIDSLSVLIGRNGAGKTSILELIRDRFFWGASFAEKIILITKNDNFYEVLYTENLFKTNYIKINGIDYLQDDTDEQEISLQINLKLKLKKIPQEDPASVKKSRLANNYGLVHLSNNWNYTNRARLLDKDADNKGYDYYDFSIGNLLDKVLRKKFVLPSRIANPEDVFDINFDERFNIDYLYEKTLENIVEILNYLLEEKNRNFIRNYLDIPSHLYIYCDYMGSDERANNFLHETEKFLLRYEQTKDLYKIEEHLYNKFYVLKNDFLSVKQSILLRILESFFIDVGFLVPNKIIQENIKNMENEIEIEKLKEKSINQLLEEFKSIVLKAVDLYNDMEVQYNKQILNNRIEQIFTGYINFIEFLSNEFFVDTDTTIIDVTKLSENQGVIGAGNIRVEIPSLMLNTYGITKTKKFLDLYKRIGTKNNIFYYVWHGLSSGEENLLNLLARLSNAIEKVNKQQIIILLDEVELSLHPEWQRQYIKILVDNINELAQQKEKSLQFLITTHSPIITSDVPSYVINYVTKLSDKNLIVKNEAKTFGNNIHNLYLDNFYLDSTVGEFAKEKINNLMIELKSKDSLSEEKIKDIKKFINIVGDPIIRQVLEDMLLQKNLYNKNSISRLEELKSIREFLDEQIANIEEGLDTDE